MMLHLDRGRVFVMERSERMSHVNECMCNSANRGGWNDASSKLCTVLLRWQLAAMGHLHYNSLSKSLKYDLWLLWAISFTIPYKNHGNITYDSYGRFPLQFLIKIIEIWLMIAMGHFLYNSLLKSLKYYLWQLWMISITIPYQNRWNMTYCCYGSFPLQFLITIIEIWSMAAMGNWHYKSLSKSLKYELWHLWAISFTIPFRNHWIWPMAVMDHVHYSSLSISSVYYLWQLWAIPSPLQFLIKTIEI